MDFYGFQINIEKDAIQKRKYNKVKKNKSNRFVNLWHAMRLEIRKNKSSFCVYIILVIFVIAALVRQIFLQNYESVFLCILTLLLLTLPSFVQVTFKIELPSTLEIVVLFFIFAAEILGELNEFYIKIPIWDTLLHTTNGFFAAAIGLSFVEIMNKNKKTVFQLSPGFTALVSFCFSMTIGIIWEFFEFSMDFFFGFDMQKDTVVHSISSVMLDPNGKNVPTRIKNITEVIVQGNDLGLGGYLDIGLIDTMSDLFVNFLGALVFSIFGYIYIKRRDRHSVIWQFVPTRKDADKDFLKIVTNESSADEDSD